MVRGHRLKEDEAAKFIEDIGGDIKGALLSAADLSQRFNLGNRILGRIRELLNDVRFVRPIARACTRPWYSTWVVFQLAWPTLRNKVAELNSVSRLQSRWGHHRTYRNEVRESLDSVASPTSS